MDLLTCKILILELDLRKRYFFLPLIMFLAGCQVPSNKAMNGAGGRTSYNRTLQTTSKEQMLLNIVRLRFFDPPYFVDVGNVTTQFTYRTSVQPSIPIPGFTEKNPAKLGGEFQWTNQPTIQYSPLQGKPYAMQLLQPLDLRSIQQLCYSGWSVDRVFSLVFQGFNGLLNAPEASGPLPERIPSYEQFNEVVKLLRHFQTLGELQIGVEINAPADEEKGEGPPGHQLQLAFPSEGPQAERLSELLVGLRKARGQYLLTMRLGFDKDGKIGVMPRSILSTLYFLSQGVSVPSKDNRAPKCFINQKDIAKNPGLISILCSKTEPRFSYISTKYRGKWYYIHDQDIESKKTFVLLLQIYNLQGGALIQPPPLLTLPLG